MLYCGTASGSQFQRPQFANQSNSEVRRMSLAKPEFFLNGPMRKPVRHLYEFGPFQLDVVNSRLLREGEVVALKPKVFDTLLVLVENGGTVMSKEDLMERLWPETIVEENNLTQNISALRKILSDSDQPYIETIPKRGYRFVVEVREVREEADDELILQRHTSAHIVIEQEEIPSSENVIRADAPLSIAAAPSLLSHRVKMAVAALLLTAIAGLTWWQISRPQHQAFNPSDFHFAPVEDWKAEIGETSVSLALSPDLKMIAYSRRQNGNGDLWIKTVNGSDARQVTTDKWDDISPVWSPDAQELAFLSLRGKPGIYRMPYLGNSPSLIKEIETGYERLIAWKKDPERIFYQAGNNLFALDIASGEIIKFTDFPDYPYIRNINLSPDGKRIVYVERTHEQEKAFIRDLTGGRAVQLPDQEEDRMNPLWLPDSSGILYSSKRNGVYQICITYLSGEIQQLTSGDSDFIVADISSDGSKIFYVTSVEESDLWRAGAEQHKDEHFTFEIKAELWPDISPDGKMIAFQQADNLSKFYDCSILCVPTRPSADKAVVADSYSDPRFFIRNAFDARWSPDGNKIAFLRFTKEIIDLWIADSIGGNERQVSMDGVLVGGLTGMPYNRSKPRDYDLSPDGKRAAYLSKKSDNWNNLCVFSFEDWKEETVANDTNAGADFNSPLWSPDSQRLAYLSRSQGKFFINIVESGSVKVIFESDSGMRLLGWSQSGDDPVIAIIEPLRGEGSVSTGMGTVNIYRISAGEKYKIAELKEAYYKNIQLSPDQSAVAFASRQDGKDNIWILPFDGRQKKITDNTDPNIYFSSLDWSPDAKIVYYSRQQRKNRISMIETFR